MRKIFTIPLVLLIVSLPNGVLRAASTCQTPVAYSIDTIDSRFNMSKYDLVQNLQLAEKAWEVPTQKDLFTYVAMGGVKVSLVYDARQAETDKEKATLAKLMLIKNTFDVIHDRFTAEASSTEARQAKNSADFAAYKADESAYNADVAASNARGGATGEEYASFSTREADLSTRFTVLKAEQDAINAYIARMNTLSDMLNLLANGVNMYTNRYNASLKAKGEHEAGVYKEFGNERTITVYEFADTNRLVRTLAHELGHALGLEHVQGDQNAIMFASNTGEGLTADATDLSELSRVCGQ